MAPTAIKRLSVNLEWIVDPDAHDYQIPCRGCPDYCLVDDPEDLTVEAYGEYHCHGMTECRRTTAWIVTLEFSWPNEWGGMNKQIVAGVGQSEDEALLAAQSNFVASQLEKDSFDVPESSVRLRPCRSS